MTNIADLEAKIAELKHRAELRAAKRDPALRHIHAALRAIERAQGEIKDPVTSEALEEARASLAAILKSKKSGEVGEIVAQPRPASIEPSRILEYLREQPGARAEQIAADLGVESGAIRPVMRKLIEDEKVRTQGQRSATSYHPV